MGTLSYSTLSNLVAGLAENISDVRTAFTEIQTVINGGIDATNITNASVTVAKVASEAYTSYTPAISGGSITLGTLGSINGYSIKQGRKVHCFGRFSLGTGGSLTGGPSAISLPYTSASLIYQHGICIAFDNNTSAYTTGMLELAPSAAVAYPRFLDITDATANLSYTTMTATTPWTWADSDNFHWNITYEAAS